MKHPAVRARPLNHTAGQMREFHAKRVRISLLAWRDNAYSLGFLDIMALAYALLKEWTDRVDSVDGINKFTVCSPKQ